ncbi:hypothetical protein ABTL57_19740, partial [Acinetobacter baumannii]
MQSDVLARTDGTMAEIDCLRINRIARTAGAPIDKGAGIKIIKKIGEHVYRTEPLYRIYSCDPSG